MNNSENILYLKSKETDMCLVVYFYLHYAINVFSH